MGICGFLWEEVEEGVGSGERVVEGLGMVCGEREGGLERVDAVLDAEESGRERMRVCDLIGYLIGFVWIWAVFVALDGDWSGLWPWRVGGGCGKWVEGAVDGGIGGLEEEEPEKNS